MNETLQFVPALAEQLPETHALILRSGLRVHDAVCRITLHGSRGPKGGARPDSDLDLCLVVHDGWPDGADAQDRFFRTVLNTTRESWQGEVELDVALAFDASGCSLHCLCDPDWNPDHCPSTVGCIGLFKLGRGFDGRVPASAVDCRKMRPLLTIWTREPIF